MISYKDFGISPMLLSLAAEAETELADVFQRIDFVRESNQLKVIKAMQQHRLSEAHFAGTTGYGYGDRGREVLDSVYAAVFGAEAAFVRKQILNGTQAVSLCLFACLRPGDEMISITGKPYDTLEEAIGLKGDKGHGSLMEYGIDYKQVDLLPNGRIDIGKVCTCLKPDSRVVFIQKSRGYSQRSALSNREIREAVIRIRQRCPEIIVIVDNCYGEFVETLEPTEAGADLAAGSLIKNPGGGIAPCGGYIAGKACFVEKVAHRFGSPGLGGEV
ncbi:MAG TPA: hypothetical protein DD727_04460, partial [Clostridiales bacterium]|nr:hypothetical protein [Clostridiales bacterium]